MFEKFKNSFRRTHDDTSRRQDNQPPPQPQSGIFSNTKLNESNVSLSSVTSSFKPRNIFRRNKMPTEFTQPPPVPRAMSPLPPLPASPQHTPTSLTEDPLSPPPYDTSTTPSDVNNTPIAQEQQPQRAKSPSGGSVRSILRDRATPSTGRSVRWNGKDATRIITPEASTSASADESVETVRINLLSRLEDTTGDEDEEQEYYHHIPRVPSPQDGGETFLSLLDPDPFAANIRTSSHHQRTESTSSAVSSTLEMDEPPSGATNLLDMSDEPPSALTDSFDNGGVVLAQFPPPQLDSPNVSEGQRPASVDFDDVRTPRASVQLYPSTVVTEVTESPVTVRDFSTAVPLLPKSDTPPSSLRPFLQQHARTPSETPTIRPVHKSPHEVTHSPEPDKSLSPFPSTPDASVYHTPSNKITREKSKSPGTFYSFSQQTSYHTPSNKTAREKSKSPGTFYSFSQQNSPVRPPLPLARDDDYMPPFLIPSSEEEPRGSEVLNSAFTVPNNSLTFPAQIITNQDDIITQLQQKLELYASLSEQYETDLSARDELVDELSIRVSKADGEATAWRNEAERTTRRFEKMRHKVSALAATCEQLTTQRQQSSLFDKASSVALQQLHQRVGSLDFSRVALEEKIRNLETELDAERAKAEKAEIDREDMHRKCDAAEEDGKYWRERWHEYERSGQELIEPLNSLGDGSAPSLGSSVIRPDSLGIMMIDEVVRSAKAGAPTASQGQFPRASTGSDSSRLHLSPFDIDPVYVLKSEMIKREQDQNEEITCLEEEKEQLLGKVAELEQRLYSMRLDASDKEVLASELETALERVERLERERKEASSKLDEERGALKTSNDELRAAEHEVAKLNAQLDDQHERGETAEAYVVELEGKLGALDATDDAFVQAKQDWVSREKWLLNSANDLEDRVQQLQGNRDNLLKQLQDERQAADKLALAHSTLAQQLQSTEQAESRLQETVRNLKQQLTDASEALSERERQCQALEELQTASEHAFQDLKSREAVARREREFAVTESSTVTEEAREAVAGLNAMLESTNTRLREVQRQNADLEMKNLQLAKTQKQLEDDNAGLYIGLEAKQQELELVKRKFGVRGTAGSIPTQGSAPKTKDSAFKVPNPPRSSNSSVAETEDGGATRIPSILGNKGLPRQVRPRVSIATPTPAAQTVSRYRTLSTRTRTTSSSSTLSSVAGNQPGTAPAKPPGLRRPESSSDADSVSSAAPAAKRLIRAPPHTKANTSGSSASPQDSVRRSSVGPNPEPSSSRSSISRRTRTQSGILKPTPEESEKENQAPANFSDDATTPKAHALRRRVTAA